MIHFIIPNFSQGLSLQARAQLGQLTSFQCLSTMLSKSKPEKCVFQDAYSLVGQILNVPEDFPRYAVSAISQFNDTPLIWSCCVSPVIISPNRDHLDLAQVNNFDLTEDEAKSYCDEFNDYFKEDGLVFSYSTPDKWFCTYDLSSDFIVSDASPFSIEGQDIASHIPQGKEGKLWRRFFNEMQMLLHHSATSQKRNALRKPDINSVWYWGGGKLEKEIDQFINEDVTVFTDDDYVQGLVTLGDGRFKAVQHTMFSSLSQNNMVIPTIDSFQWLDWDEDYFSSALQCLKQGSIKSIVFYLDLDKKYILTKKDLMKFWKANKTIFEFVVID